jgi:hypothetical protein
MNRRLAFGLVVCLLAILTVGTVIVMAADGPGKLPGLPTGMPTFVRPTVTGIPSDIPGIGAGGLMDPFVCVPDNAGIPQEIIDLLIARGFEVCAAGVSPFNPDAELMKFVNCFPTDLELNLPFEIDWSQLVLPAGMNFCAEGEKPFKVPEEMQEKLNCIPARFAEHLPFGVTIDDIDLGTLHICAEGESPFTITLPEEPPAWLVCIPSNWEELGLPIEEIPASWNLPTCGEGQSPIAVPPELVGKIKCIPPKLAELPITLPPELEGLPVCEQGQIPFDIVLPEAPANGGEWVFPDLPETDENGWINIMGQKDYISGVGNGLFGTGMDFTRGQSLVLLLRGASNDPSFQPPAVNSVSFSDVDGWEKSWAMEAKAQGLAAGYPDGTFRPNQTLTVEEVLALCSNIGGLNPPPGGDTWSEKYFKAVEKGYGIFIDQSLAQMNLDRGTAMQILGVCIEKEPVQ